MKTSFSTLGCPDWTLEQIARHAKACGYDGVELRIHADGNHLSPDISSAEAGRAARLFQEQDTPIFSLLGYSRFAYTDDAEISKNQDLLRKLLVLAETMGAKFVRTFAGKIPPGSTHEAMSLKVAAALKPLVHEAARRGVGIAIETHDDWCSPKFLLPLLKQLGGQTSVRIVHDIFNCFVAGLPWRDTYRKFKPYIAYCHLKDGYKSSDGNWCYVPLGAGDLPLAGILSALKKDSYDGYLSFEWEKKWHPELEAPERVFPHFVHKVKSVWKEI